MKIAVIGMGPAGIMATINASKNGSDVTVFEHQDEPLKKLLLTGNGKCNISNTNISPDRYDSSSDDNKLIEEILSTDYSIHLLDYLKDMGLYTTIKNGDCIYPKAESAKAVKEVLQNEINNLIRNGKKITVKYNYDIYKVLSYSDGLFQIDGESFDRLVLCCGGKSFRQTGSDGSGYEIAKKLGHSIIEPRPSLCKLISGDDMKTLSGVRARGKVTIYRNSEYIASDEGEIQFTDNGISGIPVFQVSGKLLKNENFDKVFANIDLCPEISKEELISIFNKLLLEGKSFAEILPGLFTEKICNYILQKMGDISDSSELAAFVKKLSFLIVGSDKLNNAQVTQGGVPLNEIDSRLSSVIVPGLYFAGEIMDVNGLCGGFNLHFALTTGLIAGGNASK